MGGEIHQERVISLAIWHQKLPFHIKISQNTGSKWLKQPRKLPAAGHPAC